MSSSTNLQRWALCLILCVLGGAWPTNAAAATKHQSARTTANKATANRAIANKATANKATANKKKAHHSAPRRAGRTAPKAVHHVPATKSGLPNIQALGALVLDENGRELYARNPDHERPIASISKLAATLTVVDRGLELEGLTTITKADLEGTRGGARSRLLEGMTLSNRDLLHAALMGSDNRAIPALGRAVKLSPSQLAAAMTAKAKALGLKHTRFHDPTGLSIENVSTPRETIALLRAVMNHPVLGPITQRVEYDAHPLGKPPITYVNTYRPAIRSNVQVLGGKTGYNDDARYCLVLAAKIDGHTCFMSFLSNEGKLTRFGDVSRVADWIVSRKPKGQPATGNEVSASPQAEARPIQQPPTPRPSARPSPAMRPQAQRRAAEPARPAQDQLSPEESPSGQPSQEQPSQEQPSREQPSREQPPHEELPEEQPPGEQQTAAAIPMPEPTAATDETPPRPEGPKPPPRAAPW